MTLLVGLRLELRLLLVEPVSDCLVFGFEEVLELPGALYFGFEEVLELLELLGVLYFGFAEGEALGALYFGLDFGVLGALYFGVLGLGLLGALYLGLDEDEDGRDRLLPPLLGFASVCSSTAMDATANARTKATNFHLRC